MEIKYVFDSESETRKAKSYGCEELKIESRVLAAASKTAIAMYLDDEVGLRKIKGKGYRAIVRTDNRFGYVWIMNKRGREAIGGIEFRIDGTLNGESFNLKLLVAEKSAPSSRQARN